MSCTVLYCLVLSCTVLYCLALSCTGYHSKPEQFSLMLQCHITSLNLTLGFKVRSVSKNSGISLSDRHWDFYLDKGKLKKTRSKILNCKSKIMARATFYHQIVTQKLGFVLDGYSTFTFWLIFKSGGFFGILLLWAFQWSLKLCNHHQKCQT